MNGPRVWMVVKRSGGQGGLQHQARRVFLRMLSRGTPVRLVTHRPPDRTGPSLWTDEMPSDRLPGRNRWEFAAELYGHLCRSRADYDVVHVHGFGLETFAAMAAKRVTGKPLVVKPSTAGRGTKLDRYARWSGGLLPSRGLWRGVDAWVCISEQTRADLIRLGVEPGRIADIPNGVDTEEFKPVDAEQRLELRARQRLQAEEVEICTVARLTPHKRVDLLIRSFGALSDRFPQARLRVIGTGDQQSAIQELALRTPGGSRIHFKRSMAPRQVACRMQATDCFALLSRWEGLSNALLEAMACGLPAVVTDVSGMADVVRDGVSGYVVPPDDADATTEALARLLSDADGRREMGAAAVRTVRERYSLDRTVDRLLELYGDCSQ